MSVYYKVWIEVEKVDEEEGTYENVEILDFSATQEFDTEEEAVEFANRLHDLGCEL